MCQVLRHQSRLSHRRRRPPPPPLSPVGHQEFSGVGGGGGGGRIALGAKKCCRGVFTTADVWLSSCSHSISPLPDAGQNVCEDSQPSQWLFRKREKKRGGRRGGQSGVPPSVSRRASASRTGRKKTVRPHLRPPSSSGVYLCRGGGGLRRLQRQASRRTCRQRRFC